MRALSIRQPFAELILRGIKTVELRSVSTRILGERFYIYAPLKTASVVSRQWSVVHAENVVVPTEPLPAWMIELAEQVKMIEPGALLPTGVIVGSAVIAQCERMEDAETKRRRDEETECGSSTSSLRLSVSSSLQPIRSLYRWHLTDVRRASRLRKPTGHPQPIWFNPF